jgi:hypothetical protein
VYRERTLPLRYRVDFLCYSSVVVELKAVPDVGRLERMQIVNYLRMAGANRGLLLNFGALSLQYRRVGNTWNGSASGSGTLDLESIPKSQNPGVEISA